jgi:hypothetical protein
MPIRTMSSVLAPTGLRASESISLPPPSIWQYPFATH